MNKNVINELLSLIPKGEEFMEKGKKIYKEINIKKLDISNILQKLDDQEIDIEESFFIEGIISAMAPINEPKTYIESVYKFREGTNKKTFFSVEPYPLPISKYINDKDKLIAFLYNVDAESAFVFNFEKDKQTIRDNNKFIPIVIDRNLLNKAINSKVEMKVRIKIVNINEANKIYKYKNEEFKKIVDLFYDPYNINVNSIILEVEEVINIIEKKIDLGRHSFGVEYKIIKEDYKDIESELIEACRDVSLKNLKIKALGIAGRNISIIPCRKDVYINISDNYIGFYIQIDANNRNSYRNKIKELQEVSKNVVDKLRLKGNVEISFISEEEKKVLFFS